MDIVSDRKFRDNLKSYVEPVVSNHVPLMITRRGGQDFVVVSAEDWEREQETLYVLQNISLMKQIADSALRTQSAPVVRQPKRTLMRPLIFEGNYMGDLRRAKSKRQGPT